MPHLGCSASADGAISSLMVAGPGGYRQRLVPTEMCP
jgi:hypothetical protein